MSYAGANKQYSLKKSCYSLIKLPMGLASIVKKCQNKNHQLNSLKEKQLEMTDSMTYADQQGDKSLPDNDYVAGTFGSDSE